MFCNEHPLAILILHNRNKQTNTTLNSLGSMETAIANGQALAIGSLSNGTDFHLPITRHSSKKTKRNRKRKPENKEMCMKLSNRKERTDVKMKYDRLTEADEL